jgi:hypothetical protein
MEYFVITLRRNLRNYLDYLKIKRRWGNYYKFLSFNSFVVAQQWYTDEYKLNKKDRLILIFVPKNNGINVIGYFKNNVKTIIPDVSNEVWNKFTVWERKQKLKKL